METLHTKKSETIQEKQNRESSAVTDKSSVNAGLQRKADLTNESVQRAPRPNLTGMPDNLKSGIESLSGFSMDDVRVHYNSSKPATVQALAYTQGTDIHVAPGQEQHLPHEAWHVAQQMAGRVVPTTNINGMPVNDNAALEHEADVMGEKAVQMKWLHEEGGMHIGCTCDYVQLKKIFLKPGPMNNVVGQFGNTQIDQSYKGKAKELYGPYSFHHICPKERLKNPFNAILYARDNVRNDKTGERLFKRLYEVLEFANGFDKSSYNTGTGFFGYSNRTDDPGNDNFEAKPMNMKQNFYDNAKMRDCLFQKLDSQIRDYSVDDSLVKEVIKLERNTKNKIYYTIVAEKENSDWEKAEKTGRNANQKHIPFYKLKSR